MAIRKIAVTGTKGKTTVTNMIAEILRALGNKRVMHVNTTGHFIDGIRKSTLQDSQRVWGVVPSVASGRYLYEFMDLPENEDAVAVLECSLGSSTLSGMAYGMHGIGIFLNVYEDHIGSSSRITSQEDILEAKRFVFKRLLKDGWAILNADDTQVLRTLEDIEKRDGAQTIFYGLDLSPSSLPKEYQASRYLTCLDDTIVYRSGSQTIPVCDMCNILWTFRGRYLPSVYNLLAIIAGVVAFYQGEIPKGLPEILSETRMDRYGGRLTILKNSEGVTILADYAHEKRSLREIAQLARTLTQSDGRVIGVLRLAYDRSDELIIDTANSISRSFDQFIVYDKIDGHFKMPKKRLQYDRFTQEVGKVSKLFADTLKKSNPNTEQIVREDHALQAAAAEAKPGDVVVVIVGDDIKRSIDFIQGYFHADFV